MMNRLLVPVLLLVAWLLAFVQGAFSVTEAGVFSQHPFVGALLAGATGIFLGVWAANRYLRNHYRQRVHLAFLRGREEAPQSQIVKAITPPNNYELMLREENAVLKQQLQAARQASTAAPASAQPAIPPKVAPVPPTPLPTPEATRELDGSAPVPPTTCYAPAQETGFLRDNKLAAEPLPQLALRLTLSPSAPEKASFTLNPHVNQAQLIGDGLQQLRQFFDFDLPIGRITAVSADTPGQLARQPNGWQVVRRARLLVR